MAAIAAVLTGLEPGFLRGASDETAGWISQLRAPAGSGRVTVVDIDEAAVQQNGAWPWPRATTAKLIKSITAARPRAIAIDIVLGGHCGAADPGNADLAAAIALSPTTLGFVMPGPDTPRPKGAIAIISPVNLANVWVSDGAELPCPEFIAAAQGLSLLSLSGGTSATVTTVPGVAAVGPALYPGLAADAMRLAAGSGTLILRGSPDAELAGAGFTAHLDREGDLRLHASGPDGWAARTRSASAVMAGTAEGLADRIVIVGSSLPQAGALRPTAADPLTPSAQIHADIVSGLITGATPWRPHQARWLEIMALLAGGLAAIAAALRLRPAATAGVAAAAALAVLAGAIAAYHGLGLVFDPLLPMAGIVAAGLASGLSQYSATRAAEAAIRRSFEQRLPPAVVARLAGAHGGMKLQSEERVVTALFTDIEGFTTMTRKAGPRELVRLLDGYMEGVTRLVTDRGGMVDKIVGDAVHAFFNMPLELAGHEACALDCAEAILAFTEAYRMRPDAVAAGFGRTRIGIETGPAMVGDVGASGKLDYSAHGPAVNLAARLQEANKITGTSVLVGPSLKSAAPAGWRFDSLGTHDLRGFGPMELFSPVKTS